MGLFHYAPKLMQPAKETLLKKQSIIFERLLNCFLNAHQETKLNKELGAAEPQPKALNVESVRILTAG